MPTLQQRGVRRAVDLADGTTATTARSPQILHCGYHFDPSAPLDVISDCHHELTNHTPRLSAGSGWSWKWRAPKLRCGYRCRYGRNV